MQGSSAAGDRGRRTSASAAALVGLLLAALPVHGQERPFALRLGGAVNWDSNVFRLPDSAPDPLRDRGISGKSDRYASALVGLSFDQTYSQQRLILEAVDRVIRYDKFSQLDRDELDYRGEWQWRLGSRLSGALSSRRTEGLVPFEDIEGDTRTNVAVTTNHAASAQAWVAGGLYLLGGVSQTEQENSRTFLAQPDTRQDNVDVGIRYATLAENSLSYTRRVTRGRNLGEAVIAANRIDAEYAIRQDSFAWTWASGGAHTLTGRIYRTEYTNENFSERDFSGNGGQLSHTWMVTDALSLGLSWLRDVTSWTADADASFRVDESLTVAPAWRLTEAVSVSVEAFRTTTRFGGGVAPAADSTRRDDLTGARASVSWRPFTQTTLTARAGRERRSSSDPGFDFEATTGALELALLF